jgi:hypothetical protein
LASYQGNFGFHTRPESPLRRFRVEGIPYLLLVLLAGTLAALPWVTWSRRFSLRALLIIATLLTVLLGIIVSK